MLKKNPLRLGRVEWIYFLDLPDPTPDSMSPILARASVLVRDRSTGLPYRPGDLTEAPG